MTSKNDHQKRPLKMTPKTLHKMTPQTFYLPELRSQTKRPLGHGHGHGHGHGPYNQYVMLFQTTNA